MASRNQRLPVARAKRKERRLSVRFPQADVAIIDRAAARRGRSRTDFVRDAVVRAAEDVLMETVGIKTVLRSLQKYSRYLVQSGSHLVHLDRPPVCAANVGLEHRCFDRGCPRELG
jgi:uncharacterized protein (DUF1778 family)